MEKPVDTSETEHFHLGEKIFYSDGQDGVLTQVGFDPATSTLTSIVVRLGRFFGKSLHLPADIVSSATGNGVTLTISREEAIEKKVTEQGLLLDSRSVVTNTASPTKGSLVMVAVRASDRVLVFLVARNLHPHHDVLVPKEFITGLDKDQITVSIPQETLQTMPPYRRDEDLLQDVEAVLFAITPFHIDLPGITMRVLDGTLYLDGNISSSLRSDVVESQARSVPGILDVKNNLVGDDELASGLAMTLGHDKSTGDLPIGVYPRLGDVRLSGAVRTREQKQVAGEIARSFKGVRSVDNDLVIDAKADLLNVMASAEGGEAQDKVPGKYIRHTK
jgi:osmotically-inducible protein OsmY